MSEVEKAAPVEADAPQRISPPSRISLSDPGELSAPQPSRTELTSLADKTPVPPANSAVHGAAVLGVVALAGAIWFSAVQQRLRSDAPRTAVSMPTVELPAAPASPPASPSELPPDPSAAVSGAAAASAAPQVASAAPSLRFPKRTNRFAPPPRRRGAKTPQREPAEKTLTFPRLPDDI